eukprot:CAMPEP_0174938992 /NCGR_PEP_ID=MMETSP1355-20121228/65225_1 /TAXON_ID=464990 /ORGANISM="Hemiselmis tepida, Strain CCMP443" /LENGTH=125 /DNA_ID=CAMNT_0016185969 /DNA_START=244 /DNA_END=621 /DNA_ORIENTATION=+
MPTCIGPVLATTAISKRSVPRTTSCFPSPQLHEYPAVFSSVLPLHARVLMPPLWNLPHSVKSGSSSTPSVLILSSATLPRVSGLDLTRSDDELLLGAPADTHNGPSETLVLSRTLLHDIPPHAAR